MQSITQLFPINAAGTDFRAGVLMLPDDYLTNPEQCPLIYFSHGSGEYGDGTISQVNKLYLNGSPLSQAQSLNTITCPVTGKVTRPAIFALQGLNGWCVPADQAIAGIKLMLAKYKTIDPAGIFLTGLSAGGEVSFEMLGSPDAGMFAAGFPLSCAPSVSPSLVNWGGPIGLVWARHGNTDIGGLTDKSNSIKVVDAINGTKPGYAYYQEYQGGHGGWAGVYNPSTRVTLPVTANGTPITKPMNPYEFWAMCRNTKVLFTASGTIAGTGGTNTTKVSTKAIAKATYDPPTKTITLDGSASTGAASWNWGVTYPDGKVNQWFAYGSGTPSLKTLANAPAGIYTFVLDISDSGGGTSRDTLSLQVSATDGTVIPAGSGKTISKITIQYTDGTTEIRP